MSQRRTALAGFLLFGWSVPGKLAPKHADNHSLSENRTRTEMWAWAVAFAAFCVFVECLLNMGGHRVWEYPFRERTFRGVWLIFFFGYFAFFCWIILVITRKTTKAELVIIGGLYAVPTIMNILALGLLGWRY